MDGRCWGLPGCGRHHTSRDADVTPWCGDLWGSACSEGKGTHVLSLRLCSFPSRVHPVTMGASAVVGLKRLFRSEPAEDAAEPAPRPSSFPTIRGPSVPQGRAHAAACLETLRDSEREGRVTVTRTALTHHGQGPRVPSTKCRPHVVPGLLRWGRGTAEAPGGSAQAQAAWPAGPRAHRREHTWEQVPGVDGKRPVRLPVLQKSARNAGGRTAPSARRRGCGRGDAVTHFFCFRPRRSPETVTPTPWLGPCSQPPLTGTRAPWGKGHRGAAAARGSDDPGASLGPESGESLGTLRLHQKWP